MISPIRVGAVAPGSRRRGSGLLDLAGAGLVADDGALGQRGAFGQVAVGLLGLRAAAQLRAVAGLLHLLLAAFVGALLLLLQAGTAGGVVDLVHPARAATAVAGAVVDEAEVLGRQVDEGSARSGGSQAQRRSRSAEGRDHDAIQFHGKISGKLTWIGS